MNRELEKRSNHEARKENKMLRALTTAATGMIAQQNYLDVIANNVANVNTTAFKKSRIEFQDLLSQAARTPGALMNQGTYQPVGIEIGDTRFVPMDKENNPELRSEKFTVQQGMLELSNSNVIKEMINTIQTSRNYESLTKVVSTNNELLRTAVSVGRIGQ